MADPFKPEWLQMPCLPFREIMQYVASESLEDLSSCRLTCKKWNDQIISHNILKQRMVRLKKSWAEGDPKITKNVMNFDQDVTGAMGYKWAANGDTYATVTSDFIVILHGENNDRMWSLKFEKDVMIEWIQVTKDIIVFVTRNRQSLHGPQRLNVLDIKTHSKLMSLELKSEKFLSEGSLIIVYNHDHFDFVVKYIKVIDVYDQNSSFIYTPKNLKIDNFWSFKNSTVMSYFWERKYRKGKYTFTLGGKSFKVTIFEIRTQESKVLRKYLIWLDIPDTPLGGFFADPNILLLHKDQISVYNVGGQFVRRVELLGFPHRCPEWYFDYGRVVEANKNPGFAYVWTIEDLVSKDEKPRAIAYEMYPEDEGDCEVKPVINRECVRIHLKYPRGRKAEWITMKF